MTELTLRQAFGVFMLFLVVSVPTGICLWASRKAMREMDG